MRRKSRYSPMSLRYGGNWVWAW